MTSPSLPTIQEQSRQCSPVSTPQALAWHEGTLWISSRDELCLQAIDAQTWQVKEEAPAPGKFWGATWANDALYLVSGEDGDDSRYLRRYLPGKGYDEAYRIPLPDLTGSYLSFDGEHLHVSQWYKHRVLRLDGQGQILQAIDVGAEICGHVFVNGVLYVLRGTEQNGENWHIARLEGRGNAYQFRALARVPFPCRSLTHDGNRFWTNHRAANETVSFDVPSLQPAD